MSILEIGSSYMDKYKIPNLAKACGILRLLASNGSGISSAEIEKTLDIPRTTAFRILKTLVNESMAKKQGQLYFPGSSLVEVGLQSLQSIDIRQMAVPVLQKLTSLTGETSHIAVPNGKWSMLIEVCDSPSPIRVASRAGTLADIHCSSTGKVFLAYLHEHDLGEYLAGLELKKRTEKTITDIDTMHKEISGILEKGYAMDDQEYHEGIKCLAAPVRNDRNEVVAAIGVTAIANTFPSNREAGLAESVKQAALELSIALGGRN